LPASLYEKNQWEKAGGHAGDCFYNCGMRKGINGEFKIKT
jgi:hypothetical protein